MSVRNNKECSKRLFQYIEENYMEEGELEKYGYTSYHLLSELTSNSCSGFHWWEEYKSQYNIPDAILNRIDIAKFIEDEAQDEYYIYDHGLNEYYWNEWLLISENTIKQFVSEIREAAKSEKK